jgi:hypothetical protein
VFIFLVAGVESVPKRLEVDMGKRVFAVLAVCVLVASGALAKDKKTKELPEYILHARTVSVIIDPAAGQAVEDVHANLMAQQDVMTALASWGRFEPVSANRGADLVIVIRKGQGRLVDTTTNDPRQGDRTKVVSPLDTGSSIGAQNGRQPDGWGTGVHDAGSLDPAHPQMDVQGVNDSFMVYKGDVDHPSTLASSVGWSYVMRDGLRPHSVPAVDEFKKALAAADKAAAAAEKAQPRTP